MLTEVYNRKQSILNLLPLLYQSQRIPPSLLNRLRGLSRVAMLQPREIEVRVLALVASLLGQLVVAQMVSEMEKEILELPSRLLRWL